MNTIIEINQGEYKERVMVTAANVIQVMNEIEGKQWFTVLQGEIIIDEMENANEDINEMMAIIKVGEKFLPIYEGCERPQKLKGRGYLHIYGARYYFNRYQA
jgi:hypothetical protein